jgi:hypothetical protein
MFKPKAHTLQTTRPGRLIEIGLRSQMLMALLALVALTVPMRAARRRTGFRSRVL